MQPYWQKVFNDDKTAFLFLLLFFTLAMLGKYLVSQVFDFFLIAPLVNMGFLFMAGYLLAKERRTRDQGENPKMQPTLAWRIILLISVAGWAAGFFTGDALIINLRSLLSWQLVFVGALVFGYYNPEVNRWWFRLSHRQRALLVFGLLVAYVLACGVRAELLANGNSPDVTAWFFDSVRLGPGLLLIFGAWLPLCYNLVHNLERRLQRRSWL